MGLNLWGGGFPIDCVCDRALQNEKASILAGACI